MIARVSLVQPGHLCIEHTHLESRDYVAAEGVTLVLRGSIKSKVTPK